MSEVPLYRADSVLEYIMGSQALRLLLDAEREPAGGGADALDWPENEFQSCIPRRIPPDSEQWLQRHPEAGSSSRRRSATTSRSVTRGHAATCPERDFFMAEPTLSS